MYTEMYRKMKNMFGNAAASVEKDGTVLVVQYDECCDNPITTDDIWGDIRLILFGKFAHLGHEHTSAEERKGFARLMRMKGYKVFPVYCYEHGAVAFSTSSRPCPYDSFDTCCIGFIYTSEGTYEQCEAMLNMLTSYCNGDVYYAAVYENGECEDSCGGFYDLEGIKYFHPLAEFLKWGQNVCVA